MTEPSERLKEAREAKGIPSAREAARRYGWSPDTYAQHENGTRGITRKAADRYSAALGVSPAWLLTGESAAPALAPLVGRVGAGGAVYPYEGNDVDYVELPPGAPPDVEALEVVNGSMRPVYRDRDLLFVPTRYVPPPDVLIGEECVVDVEDGRRFVKVLRRGTMPGTWRLESYNADDIEDVRILRAAPVRHVTRAAGRSGR